MTNHRIVPAADEGQENTVEVEIEPATAYAQRQAALQGDPFCKKHQRNYWPEKWGASPGIEYRFT